MRPRTFPSWLAIAGINILLPIGLLIFAKGFFPYKPYLPGLAKFSEDAPPVKAPFDKLVFMVVDALRSDFVYGEGSGFTFTQSLINDGSALPFTAYATSPTVTMPKLKALTTGSVPGFLDMILNFAESDTSSTLAEQDTWLAQVNARGGNLVMYGDDTWLKLFPNTFLRHDGTTSFFVSDFTEVDHNVTRHIDSELSRNDWTVMVMHYLGLDHIGHKAGPHSPHMVPKQHEMDDIVKQVYTAIEQQPHLKSTLFVLLGDHGMNDAGNHGGSGAGETSPALVFMSPKVKGVEKVEVKAPAKPNDHEGFEFYRKVEQSDVAPSLAGLLGLPMSKNNLGVVIPEFLTFWKPKERVGLMMENAVQLREISKRLYPGFENMGGECMDVRGEKEEVACMWKEAMEYHQKWKQGGPVSEEDVVHLLSKFSYACQSLLSSVASNYDLRFMAAGLAIMVLAVLASAWLIFPTLSSYPLAASTFTALSIGFAAIMTASSFVEEEHHYWYWAASGWFFAFVIKSIRARRSILPAISILILLRLARRWNQSGQKFAGADDIVSTYFPEHPIVLWSLIEMAYLRVFFMLLIRAFKRKDNAIFVFGFTFTVALASFGFKVSFAAQDAPEMVPFFLQTVVKSLEELPLVTQARAAMIAILGGIWYTGVFESLFMARAKEEGGQPVISVISHYLDLFLMTQTRFTNIPLFLSFWLIEHSLLDLASDSTISSPEVTISILILQFFSYFCFGGTNAISSVDLSNAYNGISGYNVFAVGMLIFVSNWVGPLYWCLRAPLLLRTAQISEAKTELANLSLPDETPNTAEEWEAAKLALRKRNHLLGLSGAKQTQTKTGEVGKREGKNGGGGEVQIDERNVEVSYKAHFVMMMGFQAVASAGVMAACWILRQHLFIWTVFSPKLLFVAAWAVGLQVVGNGVLGAGAWWGSGRWVM